MLNELPEPPELTEIPVVASPVEKPFKFWKLPTGNTFAVGEVCGTPIAALNAVSGVVELVDACVCPLSVTGKLTLGNCACDSGGR